MMQGEVTSIQVGSRRQFHVEGEPAKAWTSAICKSAVTGPVHVGPTNISGDEQADLVHHGGVDKAILAYVLKHYEDWKTEFPEREFEPGGFGENLTLSGIEETTCCIGDTFRIGDCLLQISQPRQPCWKLSRRWNLKKLALLVQKNGRTGWYLRVLQQGDIAAGMTVELIERPFPEFTVSWASSVMYAKPRSADDDLRLADCPFLSQSWKKTLTERASDGREPDPERRLFNS